MRSLTTRVNATADKIAMKTTEKSELCGTAPLGIELQCARCGSDVSDYKCNGCGFQIRTIQGIVHALPPERVAYHARFVEEYLQVCYAQFSGHPGDEFFLRQPYGIARIPNSADWSLKARSFDCLLRRVLKPAAPRDARILDIGAGNCWLSYRLALAGFNPCAIDLVTDGQHGLGAAEHYRNYLPVFFPRIRAEMAHLPFKDGQFHAAIFNASLHYAEDFEEVLREALRCCKPDGIVIISETPNDGSVENERHLATRPLHPFLTDETIDALGKRLKIRWSIFSPRFGPKWTFWPMNAWLRNRPEPQQFPLYAARKMS